MWYNKLGVMLQRGVTFVDRITLFNKDLPNLGLYTRTSTQGEELVLVKQFIDYYCNRFLHDNKFYNLAVFIEPRVSSGFPDIVFASYVPTIMDNWSDVRMHLNTSDLKILSFLISTKNCNGAEIISALKLPEKQVITSLEKLYDAKLISRTRNAWRPRELKHIYSIKKLVSVEAKISDIRRVAEQSFINMWFASHSYALTNSECPQSNTIQKFSKSGIGLYCKGKTFKKVLEARKLDLPSSYLSLQFNEWIGNSNAQ